MARSSNLYGVTVGSKGNVNNGSLNAQSLSPMPTIKSVDNIKNLIVNPSREKGPPTPCATFDQIRLVQGAVAALNPAGINGGLCGPDLRTTAPTNTNTSRAEPPVVAPAPVPEAPDYLRRINDWINISNNKTSGNTFKPVLDGGVGTSPFRPEVIALSDFVPLYERGDILKFTDSGLFVDVLYQSQRLRQQTLAKIVANIQQSNSQTTADEQFQVIVQDFNNTIKALEKDLSVAADVQSKIANIRNVLDVKNIPDSAYASKLFVGLKAFATQKMQYSERQISRFATTKLLAQMLFDLKSTIDNYSVGLLDLSDPDRRLDQDPIKLDKTYTISNGFNFSLRSLASNETNLNATEDKFVNAFIASLPSRKTETIKILTTLVCKELAISKGLTNKVFQDLLAKKYSGTNNVSAFNAIIGDVGATIFDITPNPNSIMSLLSEAIPNSDNATVLPFESKYIDSNNNTNIFVPGSSYYADSIFDIDGLDQSWNTKPLIDYVTKFAATTDSAVVSLASLLGYEKGDGALAPSTLIANVYSDLEQSLSAQSNDKGAEKATAVLAGVLRLAEKDAKLKNMLFQYALLCGMRTNSSADETPGFRQLADELVNMSSLSYARLESTRRDNPESVLLSQGAKASGQYLESMANAISKRTIQLAEQNVSRSSTNSKDKSKDQLELDIKFDDIVAAMKVATKTSLSQNVIKSFVSNYNRLFKAAQDNGSNNFIQKGKTACSGLTASTLALMVFELCSSMFVNYTATGFERTASGSRLVINFSKNDSTRRNLAALIRRKCPIPTYVDIINVVESIPVNPKLAPMPAVSLKETDNELDVRFRQGELYELQTKVIEEYLYPANVLYILQSIKAYLRNSATSALSFFQQNKLQKYLVDNNIDSDKLEILQNPSQLRVSTHILDNIKSLSPTPAVINNKTVESLTNKLVVSDNITPNEYGLIRLMMSEKPYLPEATYSPGKQIKIFSVGIPAGFSKQLVDRVNAEEIGFNSLVARQGDIVEVLVYKRDLRFEDIIFKPLSFAFDMSLFVDQISIDSLQINETMHFDSLISKMNLVDYVFSSGGAPQKKLYTLNNIEKSDEYRYAIPDIASRRQMFKNHVVSYILDMYLSLLTGMKLDEATFIQTQSKPERSMDTKVFTMVYTYIKDIMKKDLPAVNVNNITQQTVSEVVSSIIDNEELDEETKDYFRLFTYGTIATNKEYVKALVNQPKIFDRVFNVPVDISHFEVDLDATLANESGRQAWGQTYVQDNMERTANGGYKVKDKKGTDLIFEDYFVRIQTAIDKD